MLARWRDISPLVNADGLPAAELGMRVVDAEHQGADEHRERHR